MQINLSIKTPHRLIVYYRACQAEIARKMLRNQLPG